MIKLLLKINLTVFKLHLLLFLLTKYLEVDHIIVNTAKKFSKVVIQCYCILICIKNFIYLFLERGEGKEKERERNINVWLPLVRPLLGTWLATQACSLTGIELATPWSAAHAQSTDLHQLGLYSYFLAVKF